MAQQIALTICIVFILYLLRIDAKRKPNVSYALWIPWIWFAISASRAVSYWFGMGTVDASSEYYLEGSPFDRNVFIALIAVSIIILFRRKVDWGAILKKNKFIFIYILYLGLSTLWSDYTFVSFKRWIKELGNITMVLVILTEADPIAAVKTMIIRCAYVLIPLSLVFNRYFPELSRFYSIGGGDPQFTGVTTDKNSLGALCMICGIVIFWNFLNMWREKRDKKDFKTIVIHIVFIFLITWLLYSAHSATAILATIIGAVIIFILGMQHIRNNTRSIKYYVFFIVVIFLVIYLVVDLPALITSSLGRDETLTGRTEFWQELIAMNTNPWIGTGYESFWLGDRIAYFWDKYWWHPNQAHNGYLEIYLNLGFIGLIFLIGIILAAFKNIRTNLLAFRHYDYQVLRIAFVVIMIVVNITEAYFKGPAWFIFLLIAMEPQQITNAAVTEQSIPDNVHIEKEN